jgi:hypothetical protein
MGKLAKNCYSSGSIPDVRDSLGLKKFSEDEMSKSSLLAPKYEI